MGRAASEPRATSRRRVLTGAVALGAGATLAGCGRIEPTVDRLRALVGGSKPSTPPSAPAAPTDPTDPDVRLAVEVVLVSEAAATALENWAASGTRRPARVRRAAMAAAATHTRHADLVADAVPQSADPGSGRLAPALVEAIQTPQATLRSVVRIEELAGAGLREASLAARSGPFASLLASMVAASSQHSALLQASAGTGGDR